jgi:PLP dependent protein
MNKIIENINRVTGEIDTSKIKIVAVTKFVDVPEIITAYEAGIRDFGENKLQEIERKRANLPEDIEKNIKWHFIGHLQTNKAKKAAGNFDFIHSVDSLRLAQSISEHSKAVKTLQKILIQVDIAKEETKYGYDKQQLKEELPKIKELNSIEVKGLMTIAPYTNDEKVLRTIFKELRDFRDNIEKEFNISFPELSMGMSNDYKAAVQEGSTMIRLGSAIFR